jgi:hypothetical protein
MGNDLFSYIARLELIAFFSGYPLIYLVVMAWAGKKNPSSTALSYTLVKSLPHAYALTGTIYLGLLLKDLSPDYSLKNITEQLQPYYLKIWGLLSLLFWIPFFSKKNIYSLLHSLLFFLLIIRDLYNYLASSLGAEMVQNDMKIYTTSILINSSTLFIIAAIRLLTHIRRKKVNPQT